MSKDTEARCPCCQGSLEHYPDQDGSCDRQCVRCGWSEHVPDPGSIAAALTLAHARSDKQQPPAEQPTLVILVEAGVVQAVQGDVPVRVIVCDFDNPRSADRRWAASPAR